MTDASAETTHETELLAFRLGEQEYCLDIMSVREIRGWTRATPLPFAPDHMKGVINLRGAILPVIDLAVRLGMPPVSGGERNVIIVVCVSGRTAGLLVDSVSDILSIAGGDLQLPPDLGSDGPGMCISALTLVDERLIRVLDLGAVLPARTADAA